MSKFRKFVLVRLAAAGLGIASVSVLANKEDASLIEHGPGHVVGPRAQRQSEVHDKITDQKEGASKALAEKSKPATPKDQSDWSELLALHAEAEGLSIRYRPPPGASIKPRLSI
jgi:hypothetical protein